MIYLLYNQEMVLGRLTCSPDDIEQNSNGELYTQDLFPDRHPSELTVADGVICLKSEAELDADVALKSEINVRSTRNFLLQQSDWTQVADAPVDQAAWATYRQALRDVTDQDGFPDNVVWPSQP